MPRDRAAGSTAVPTEETTNAPAYDVYLGRDIDNMVDHVMVGGSHRTCDVWGGYVMTPRVIAEPTRQAEARILQAVANEHQNSLERDMIAWMRENAFAVGRRTPTGGGGLYELYKETTKASEDGPSNKFNMEEVW